MVQQARLEPAFCSDVDPVDYAQVLSEVHQARLAGRPLPARPRPVIEHSWNRMQRIGVPMERQDPDVDETAAADARAAMVTTYGTTAGGLEKLVGSILGPTLADSGLVGIFATADARVTSRFGDWNVLQAADGIGFVPGARWGENSVGTNAIDMATRLGRPIQVHGPEHWCLDQHLWSCAAAPLRDPASGQTIGVLDISGPLDEAHPAILGLIKSVTAQVELSLRNAHLRELERLRTRSWHLVADLQVPWLLCDRHGWVLGASHVVPTERISLGTDKAPLRSGRQVLPGVGLCEVDNLGDVVRITQVSPTHADHAYVLDPAASTLEIELGDRTTTHHLSGRHTAIILTLAGAHGAMTPTELAIAAWPKPGISDVAVRAEVSRLRKRFPSLVSAAPYMLQAEVRVR